jgi:hypothetical protein
VVDVALGGSQLMLSVLQSGAGVIEVISLEVMTVTSHHQLVIPFLDARLKTGVLLEKLLVALLNVLDGAVLGLHLAGVLLQTGPGATANACSGRAIPPALELGQAVPPALPPGPMGGNDAVAPDWYV